MKQASIKHEYIMQILEIHLDTFGHVNNAKTLEILEQARWEFMTMGGFGLKDIQETQTGPVLLDIQIRFKKELLLRTKIKIVSQSFWELGSKILDTHQEIFLLDDDKDEVLCTKATFRIGFMDMKKRKLMDMPLRWIESLGIKSLMTD